MAPTSVTPARRVVGETPRRSPGGEGFGLTATVHADGAVQHHGRITRSLAVRDKVLDRVGERAGYYPSRVRVPAVDGPRERHRLIEADVRRQGRHVGVDHGLVDDRPLRGPRLLPGRLHFVRIVHPYPLEA